MNALFRSHHRLLPLLPAVAGAVAALDNKDITQAEKAPSQGERLGGRTGLLFVGTGSSTGCPKPMCSMLFPGTATASTKNNKDISKDKLAELRKEYKDRCHTSIAATQNGDPTRNKDYRNNPALLISQCSSPGNCHNILIDAGKTFREGALRWFPPHSIGSLDAIILTHHHMDAAGGLDDVRGFQHAAKRGTMTKAPQMVPMPLHLSQECLNDVSQRFPWLFPKQQPGYTSGTVSNIPVIERHVASFDLQVFQDYRPMSMTKKLDIIPLPVWHGEDLISYGFAFTLEGKNILYISDISRMPAKTLESIQTKLPPTDIFIVDALMPENPHPVHFSLKQAKELALQIQAKQTYIIGMNCDAFPLHDDMNAILQKQTQGKVQLAYDGQVIVL